MHLDTIFTRINQHECLVYPPYFTDSSRELLNVVKIDLRHEDLRFTTQPNLLTALREVGIELKPIFCGRRTTSSSSGSSGPTAPTRSPWRRASS